MTFNKKGPFKIDQKVKLKIKSFHKYQRIPQKIRTHLKKINQFSKIGLFASPPSTKINAQTLQLVEWLTLNLKKNKISSLNSAYVTKHE